MNAPDDSLDRFLVAQAADYATALAELQRGSKESHWVWYVLPQLRGLGMSAMSHQYGISGLQEARSYLEHPVLGPRLRACVAAICAHRNRSAVEILGEIDALKFRSCLTLFAAVDQDREGLFVGALSQFFADRPDPMTTRLLASNHDDD